MTQKGICILVTSINLAISRICLPSLGKSKYRHEFRPGHLLVMFSRGKTHVGPMFFYSALGPAPYSSEEAAAALKQT
jgi:hypothetical protein